MTRVYYTIEAKKTPFRPTWFPVQTFESLRAGLVMAMKMRVSREYEAIRIQEIVPGEDDFTIAEWREGE